MNICVKPMYFLDLCQDILDIVIRDLKYIRIHKSLKKKWTPYCSQATWYLWRSLDPIPVNY